MFTHKNVVGSRYSFNVVAMQKSMIMASKISRLTGIQCTETYDFVITATPNALESYTVDVINGL